MLLLHTCIWQPNKMKQGFARDQAAAIKSAMNRNMPHFTLLWGSLWYWKKCAVGDFVQHLFPALFMKAWFIDYMMLTNAAGLSQKYPHICTPCIHKNWTYSWTHQCCMCVVPFLCHVPANLQMVPAFIYSAMFKKFFKFVVCFVTCFYYCLFYCVSVFWVPIERSRA